MLFTSSHQSFLRARCGAVSVELGLMAMPFFLLLLGVMEVGFDLYAQEALDDATANAARLVATGQVPGPIDPATFVQNYVCPTLGPLLVCNGANPRVNLACLSAGASYYTAIGSTGIPAGSHVDTGPPGQFMLLQLWYTGPSFLSGLLPSFSQSADTANRVTYASAGFVNELFTGGQHC